MRHSAKILSISIPRLPTVFQYVIANERNEKSVNSQSAQVYSGGHHHSHNHKYDLAAKDFDNVLQTNSQSLTTKET